MRSIETLFATLNAAGVRYVVVGGLAVVLHGVTRFTADVDLIVDLSEAEARRAIDALTATGLVPRAPVPASAFAEARTRQSWQRDKHMQVFSLYDPADPLRVVDLFVDDPLPFADLWQRSVELPLRGVPVRTAALADLLELKRRAGRPQDLADIEALERLPAREGR